MKYLYCCIIILLSFETCRAQISPSDSKKISKILGENFIELTPQKSYPYSSLNEKIIVDTSLLVPGDTTGIYFNNEFLLFRNAIHFKLGAEHKKMMSANYVSVAEYQEFQNYVRDSIAREMLFFGHQQDKEALKYLAINSKSLSKKYIAGRREYTCDRITARKDFSLNWNKKFNYNEIGVRWPESEVMPLLNDLYLPFNKRFYKQRVFDQTKFIYSYNDKEDTNKNKLIPTGFQVKFEKFSNFVFDEYAILNMVYTRTFPEYPIIGINGKQAEAFCYWQQNKIQIEFNRKKINYSVKVTLPMYSDLKDEVSSNCFSLEERNYTKQWQINDEEYQKFICAVQDSLSRENLYREIADDEFACSFLIYEEQYFDYKYLTIFNTFDPSDRTHNRTLFPLNYSVKIDYKYDDIAFEDSKFKQDSTFKNPKFKYYYIDVQKNNEIKKVETAILPDSTSKETQIIKKITYEQALAFYHWKYPIQKYNKFNDWQNYVFPTASQFQKIQRGEEVIVAEKKVEFPSPFFRLVVHVYPKNISK